MKILFSLLPAVIVAMYGALLATWVHLASHPNKFIEKLATRLSWISLSVYFLWLLLISLVQNQIPFASIGQLAALIGFFIWAAHIYAQKRMKQGILIVLPVVTVIFLILLSLVLGTQPTETPEIFEGEWVSLHIAFTMAGVALLLGAGVYGFGYLVLHRQIKKRKFGPLFSLMPSLNDLNMLRSLTVSAGWLFVTLGILFGSIWMLMRTELFDILRNHLGIALFSWGIITLMALASRFRWLKQRQLAGFSALLSVIMIVLIIMSMFITYLGWT